MFKVGITGQSGFIGTHLFNFLGLKKDIIKVKFKDEYFDNKKCLENFVKKCDIIVHLAAMNRHNEPQVIYNTNIILVNKLIVACEQTKSKPHILFSSSTQENRDNLYGKSKKDGRALLESWAKKNNARFTAMIIPNVFGPFGNPYYNSVIATFCYQLSNNEEPKIQIDGQLKLIYVNNLTEEFYKNIISEKKDTVETQFVSHTSEKKVSEILKILNSYKADYFEKGIFPDLSNKFELQLFNTFRCYMPNDKFPMRYIKHTDSRGSFVEIVRTNSKGQFSYSTTKPDITRGEHFHIRKAERFAVIKGKALISLRRIGSNKIVRYELNGKEPSFVDMPIWNTHNIKNIGTDELVCLFWISEHYNPDDADTYFENVEIKK